MVHQRAALVRPLRVNDVVQRLIRDAVCQLQEPFPLQKDWPVGTVEWKPPHTRAGPPTSALFTHCSQPRWRNSENTPTHKDTLKNPTLSWAWWCTP